MALTDLTLFEHEPGAETSRVLGRRAFSYGWLIVGGLTVVGTAAITYLSYVRLMLADPGTVGALGTALGFGGLFAAFVGFGLTLWQLVRTAKAADAAANAVRNVKRDYGSFDTMAELASAKGLNETIRVSLSAGDRLAAKARYDRLRESLVRIASSPHALQAQISTHLKDDAADVIDALNVLREISEDSEVPWNKMIGTLEQLDSYLISVTQKLRDTISG